MSEFDEGKTRSGCWVTIFLVILLITPRFWLCFIPGTHNYKKFYKSSHPRTHQNCLRNILEIKSAIEMHNLDQMDQNAMLTDINSEADLQRLVDLGFLKYVPRCQKYYSNDHPYLSFWLGWEDVVIEVPDCYEGHDLAREGKISCKLHKDISD